MTTTTSSENSQRQERINQIDRKIDALQSCQADLAHIDFESVRSNLKDKVNIGLAGDGYDQFFKDQSDRISDAKKLGKCYIDDFEGQACDHISHLQSIKPS